MSRRVLITGSQGKVGRHVVAAFKAGGWETIGVDLGRGVFDTPLTTDPTHYIQADLAGDAGAVYSCLARFPCAAVVHVAAIPDPTHSVPHDVFRNNIASTFNVVEACVRLKVPRLVNISSETVPGFFFPERTHADAAGLKSGVPLYCPVDEAHPIAPQDPYALSKHFGEQLCDAAVRRADISIVSIRPSWCQDSNNIERNLGPFVADRALYQPGMWSYIVIQDLAAAIVLAAGVALGPVHEVVYIAAADNIGGRDLAAAVAAHFGAGAVPVKALERADASGISCAKARALLGWSPVLTWRDFLTPEGKAKPAAAGPA